jgi:hypothetical protein
MDNKLIQQYGEDILCYRMRTARQKKRMQYEDFDKQLIRLYKEERALYGQRRNLGWEPLVPPVQKGWKRFFVLREEVAKSGQASFFESILAKINTVDWSYRKNFLIRKRKYGRKIYVVKEQKLLKPDEAWFIKIGFSEVEKQFFREEYYFGIRNQIPVKRYVFNEPWRFVLRIRPNIIDKVRVRDEWLEARLKQIDNYLERNAYRGRQAKLLHGSSGWRLWIDKEKYDEGNPVQGRSFQDIIDQGANDIL